MALILPCDRCGKELMEKGAILLGPPFDYNGHDVTPKYHICVKCWDWLVMVTMDVDLVKKREEEVKKLGEWKADE